MKNNTKHIGWLVSGMVTLLLVIDQIIKVYIKTHFYLGESVEVFPWFYIEFVENNGMAWGMTFFNKLVLSLFRSVAIAAIIWYIYRLIKSGNYTLKYLLLVSMVLAGAAGNMFDSMFYGLCFSASTPYYVSYSVPFGQGYESFLMGKVVDMFRFPFFTITWPDWIPFIGGDHFTFFDPVFNFADSCVSVGVISMLLFCREELENIGYDIGIRKKTEEVEEDNK